MNSKIYQNVDNTLALLNIQDQLNKHLCGEDYLKTKICAKSGRKIVYARAAWLECAELTESMEYKWWKGTKNDIENMKLECVDIYHFMLSMFLEYINDYAKLDNNREVPEKEKRRIIEEIVRNVKIEKITTVSDDHFTDSVLMLTESLASSFINYIYSDYKEKKYLLIEIYEKWTSLASFLYTEADFTKLYISKSILNKFRSDMNYNEDYNKLWYNGQEDNVALKEIMDELLENDPKLINNVGEFSKQVYSNLKLLFDQSHNS